MKKFNFVISDFHILRPKYESSQKNTLEWIASAHTKAESKHRNKAINSEEMKSFAENLGKRLHHVGCKPGIIDKRGHTITDFHHDRWQEMDLFNLEKHPNGGDLGERAKKFQSIVDEVAEVFYPAGSNLPDHAIHVSCTGYVSPSCLQKLVSRRKGKTQVTHAYHMGCYASIPALRIAAGNLHLSGKQVDIIHTEICSFHYNPLEHNPEALVVQSLFADGFIKYSMSSGKEVSKPHFRLLTLNEEIVPESLDAMEWNLSGWGFQMKLSKEIPQLIKENVKNFVENLCHQAGFDENDIFQNAIFAIHPGGPKIIKQIQTNLNLKDHQLETSKYVLKNYGNMSSATLPHIWTHLLEDEKIQSGTKVVSLAFGPGLNIAGAILEKGGE